MNPSLLEQLAEAVLYEGYILYPYRASSKKNCRERFTFGRVYPEAYSVAQNGVEPFVLQSECLVKSGGPAAKVEVSVRFLQPMAREIGVLEIPTKESAGNASLKVVPELRVGNELFQTWIEAVERRVIVPPLVLGDEPELNVSVPFSFTGSPDLEPIRGEQGLAVGVISRRQETIEGAVEVQATALKDGLFKLRVRVLNHTPVPEEKLNQPEEISMRTIASTHAALTIEHAEFISLLDPPAEYKQAVEGCKNIGLWPVLVGNEARNERDTMLASPIILYDYPRIARESAGQLFDGTEIDEILTLRILTMTDEEKREMRGVDEHARRLLERTQAIPQDSLLRMHGVMRVPETTTPVDFDDFFGTNTRRDTILVAGAQLRAGDRVRIRPRARADVMDIALSGKTAVIEAIEEDMEKRIHLALVLENDPGKDLGMMRQPGHRFFYGVDEVEPLLEEAR